jgi:alpha-L-arabinofuranosidase
MTALQRNWQRTTEPLSTLSMQYALLWSQEQTRQSLGVQHIMAVTKPIGHHKLVIVDLGDGGVARSDAQTITYLSVVQPMQDWATHDAGYELCCSNLH